MLTRMSDVVNTVDVSRYFKTVSVLYFLTRSGVHKSKILQNIYRTRKHVNLCNDVEQNVFIKQQF